LISANMRDFEVEATRREVRAWSSRRLPFEPDRVVGAPWLIDFRIELRAALRALEPAAGDILVAEFASKDDLRFDVENVLFYNVGADAFRHVARDGISFARRALEVAPTRSSWAHYTHRYTLRSVADAEAQRDDHVVLASWTAVAIDAFGSRPSASAAWYPMREADVLVHSLAERGRRIAVRLTVDVPTASGATAADLMKPLLDGVISSFHAYVGQDQDELARRIGAQLHVAPDRIGALLGSSDTGVLEPRNVVKRWSTGVQWDPADDRCDAGVIIVNRSAGGWRLSGEIAASEGER
jgi:hypothetical protein